MQATVVQRTFKHISNYANILFDLAEWEKALEYLRTDVCHDLMRFFKSTAVARPQTHKIAMRCAVSV